MAEGWARHLKGGQIEAYSAGVLATGLNPLAVEVMAESGVDISRQRSKEISKVRNMSFDYVVTLCADADRNCPRFPGRARVIHVPFDDPPTLAMGARTDEEARVHYRRVRDEIRAFVEKMPMILSEANQKKE